MGRNLLWTWLRAGHCATCFVFMESSQRLLELVIITQYNSQYQPSKNQTDMWYVNCYPQGSKICWPKVSRMRTCLATFLAIITEKNKIVIINEKVVVIVVSFLTVFKAFCTCSHWIFLHSKWWALTWFLFYK